MNKYHVRISETLMYDLLIDAEDTSEAAQKGCKIPLGSMDYSEDGGIKIEYVKELRDCTEERE